MRVMPARDAGAMLAAMQIRHRHAAKPEPAEDQAPHIVATIGGGALFGVIGLVLGAPLTSAAQPS